MRTRPRWRSWSGLVDTRTAGAALRWLGLLERPLDDRLPLREALAQAWSRPLAPGVGWLQVFGVAALFLVFVLAATGVLLAFHYEAHPEVARNTVIDISTNITGGWLIRGIHAWAADLLVVLVLVHALRSLFMRAYRAPRQATWVVGVLILPAVISFHFTGSVLPWDQEAFDTVRSSMREGGALPLAGPIMTHVAGGSDLTDVALGRAFALHVVLLPWILYFLVSLHLRLVQRHGLARRPSDSIITGEVRLVLDARLTPSQAESFAREIPEAYQPEVVEVLGRQHVVIRDEAGIQVERLLRDPRVDGVAGSPPLVGGEPFFPKHFLRLLSALVVIMGGLILLAAWFPPPIAAPYDPFQDPGPHAQPWYLLWYQGLRDLLPGALATLLLFLLPLVAIFWPAIDSDHLGHPRRRWLAPLAGILALIVFALLTLRGGNL